MMHIIILLLWAASLLAGCATPAETAAPTNTIAVQTTNTPVPIIPSATPAAPTATPTSTATPTRVPVVLSTAMAPGFPAQPEGVPFPTGSWPEGDWPAGIDQAGVDKVVDTAFANGDALRVRAVVIIYGGKLIYERYSPNAEDGPGKLMPGYSMAKSITSALVGILVRDGRLSIDAPAEVPEWSVANDPRAAITIDDLLRMSSGLEWKEGRYPDGADQTQMFASDDAAAYAANKPLLYDPGTQFNYSSGNTIIVDRIMAKEVGPGYAFQNFMRTELLDKIGLTRLDWNFDKAGTWLGSYAVDASVSSFAKFGLLYLRDGVWDGERILPEGWVDYSRSPALSNLEYGAGWWLDTARPGVFYAIGIRGQVITVDPAHDLTFVTLATDSQTSLPVSDAILDAFAGK